MKKKLFVCSILFMLAVSPFTTCEVQARVWKVENLREGNRFERGSLQDRFFQICRVLVLNKKNMNIFDALADDVKNLSEEVRADISGQEEEIAKVDAKINDEFEKHVMDQVATTKLIDKKFKLENKKMKSLMDAYVKLKGLVSEEQVAKAKNIWLHQLGVQR